MLRRDGIVANHKRVFRVYRSANLQVRKRAKRRVAFGRGEPPISTTSVNERWSLDFVHDTLQSARRIRALTIVDDFTREVLTLVVDTSIGGLRVCRELAVIAAVRGLPKLIVMDNGAEFTGKALDAWAYQVGVKLLTGRDRGLPGLRLADYVEAVGGLDHRSRGFPKRRLIVDDQYSYRHMSRYRMTGFAGGKNGASTTGRRAPT